MGCLLSKEKGCRCNSLYSATPRSFSMFVYHPLQTKGDCFHVTLTSSTLGTLKFNSTTSMKSEEKEGLELNLSEVETINIWELMEGLEDTTNPCTPFEKKKTKGHYDDDDDDDDDDVVVNVKVDDDLCGKKDKVVLYFTSLHGVRKTYEDCCNVRLILKGLGVKVDERDVSIDCGFKDELRELLGDGYSGGQLPLVFVGGNCIGGAEEIQRLHDNGKLEKLLGCSEKIEEGVCGACGDVRFILCQSCFGSCKIYSKRNEHEEECIDGVMGECGFQHCPSCNENGLIRCPMCCN